MTGNKPVRVVATTRDLDLLARLAEARILDREQIQIVAGIRRVNRANDRLHRLHATGVIRRHFLGTAAGGRKAIYSLSPKGARLISHEKAWRFQHPEDELLIGDSFTAHQTAVNWVWISARYKRPDGVEFLRWLNFQEPLTPALPLIPDGYFEIQAEGEIRAQFVEVDLGTESGKVWERKVQLYVKLATSGEFARIFHRDRFRVLVTAPTERRLANIRQTVSKQTSKLFFFLDNTTINRDGLYAPLWLRPDGATKQSLL
jgi:hypothetical protein